LVNSEIGKDLGISNWRVPREDTLWRRRKKFRTVLITWALTA